MRSPAALRADLRRHGFDVEFLRLSSLTDAQLRKIPLGAARSIAARLPLGRLPVGWHPHLEVVAARRR